MHQHIKIGKIVATFGVNGCLIITHNLGKKSTLKNVAALFVEQANKQLLPYFIKEVKAKAIDENTVLFEDITTKEAAQKLVGKAVWLLQEDFQKQSNKKSPIALIGYSVISNDVVVGIVNEVIEQTHQILFSVTYKNNEAYLPMHDDNLMNINHQKKTIELELPDGLLELYE